MGISHSLPYISPRISPSITLAQPIFSPAFFITMKMENITSLSLLESHAIVEAMLEIATALRMRANRGDQLEHFLSMELSENLIAREPFMFLKSERWLPLLQRSYSSSQ
ncbi:Lipase_GDSL domain-containing protein [Psidium guajava]|nr:Lipase_GDSL domain-containing protein [Psidium guajava]